MARIRRIVVEKLFGVFDHDIRLNEGGITLIHGPNGYGKTAILRLVDYVINCTEELPKWPYDAFMLELDDGRTISTGDAGRPAREGTVEARLIKTKRLSYDASGDVEMMITLGMTTDAMSWVNWHLARRYQETQGRYAEVAQGLERSFPMRALEAGNDDPRAALWAELLDLEAQRRELHRLGLIAEEGETFSLPDREVDGGERRILEVYVRDTRKKLAVFDGIRHRVALFVDIINRRFTYKRCQLSKEGLAVTAPDGRDIPLANLSSGEQHEIVLLYELLFETASGTLVMIDEPELSLHVAWQIEWLRDLERIVEVTGIDVLVATHSPQIINDRWDLTVELKGPEA